MILVTKYLAVQVVQLPSGKSIPCEIVPFEKIKPWSFFNTKKSAHPHSLKQHFQNLMRVGKQRNLTHPLESLLTKKNQYYFLKAQQENLQENINEPFLGYIQIQLKSDSEHRTQFIVQDLISASYFFPQNPVFQVKGVGTALIRYAAHLYTQLPALTWSERPLIVNSCYSGVGFFEKLGMYPLDTLHTQQQYYFSARTLTQFTKQDPASFF